MNLCEVYHLSCHIFCPVQFSFMTLIYSLPFCSPLILRALYAFQTSTTKLLVLYHGKQGCWKLSWWVIFFLLWSRFFWVFLRLWSLHFLIIAVENFDSCLLPPSPMSLFMDRNRYTQTQQLSEDCTDWIWPMLGGQGWCLTLPQMLQKLLTAF